MKQIPHQIHQKSKCRQTQKDHNVNQKCFHQFIIFKKCWIINIMFNKCHTLHNFQKTFRILIDSTSFQIKPILTLATFQTSIMARSNFIISSDKTDTRNVHYSSHTIKLWLHPWRTVRTFSTMNSRIVVYHIMPLFTCQFFTTNIVFIASRININITY